ncbi:MAG TPA: hypothetical protein VEG34_16165 [Thermoanaerobaculia bacterium]|nr:hypothetical protein [Thermoanaerobaculia bacterium]
MASDRYKAQTHVQLGDMGADPFGRHPIRGLDHVVEIPVARQEPEPTAVTVQHRLPGPRTPGGRQASLVVQQRRR